LVYFQGWFISKVWFWDLIFCITKCTHILQKEFKFENTEYKTLLHVCIFMCVILLVLIVLAVNLVTHDKWNNFPLGSSFGANQDG
jgi:surface polysaccharide O-acyltransferase-like enzyme